MRMSTSIKPLNSEELTYFSSQLSLILKSSVNLSDGLSMLLEDNENEKAKSLIFKILETVNSEKPLYMALESTGVFSTYYISMVRIGELTGKLDEILDGLAIYYERESGLKNSIKGAVIHPLILIFMMSIVIGILVLKVIPIFKQVFLQLGADMPASSVSAIEFSTSTGVVMLCAIGVIILLLLMFYLLSFFPKVKLALIGFLSNFILFRGLIEKISISNFSSAMSFMIISGIESSKALELSMSVISNKKLEGKILSCHKKVLEHIPFANAIAEVGIFPSLYAQMIKISYKTGSIDVVWKEISKQYDDDVTVSLNNLVSFIEPLLVGLLSIVIGVILISVMLPLMGVMSSLG